jgi:hypothetical protein
MNIETIFSVLLAIIAMALLYGATQKVSPKKWMLWIEIPVAIAICGALSLNWPIWLCLLILDFILAICVYSLE